MGRNAWKGIVGREKIYNNLFTGVEKDTAPKKIKFFVSLRRD